MPEFFCRKSMSLWRFWLDLFYMCGRRRVQRRSMCRCRQYSVYSRWSSLRHRQSIQNLWWWRHSVDCYCVWRKWSLFWRCLPSWHWRRYMHARWKNLYGLFNCSYMQWERFGIYCNRLPRQHRMQRWSMHGKRLWSRCHKMWWIQFYKPL
jgi:hypothetical protein